MIDKPELVRCGKGHKNMTMIRRMGNLYGIAKITDQQAAEIRARYAAGNITQADLAAEYKIHRSSISNIIRWRCWKSSGEVTP